MINTLYQPPFTISPQVREEAARLWASGMFEDYGDKERDKFAIRARCFPRPGATCFWLEVVGDLDGPALSVLLVRHRAASWVPGGVVTCIVAGREYTLIPNWAFWDWEQLPDGSYETLTFTSFDNMETREAFGAMVRRDQPVLIRMQGGDQVVELNVDEVDLQWLRDLLTIYRAGAGAWQSDDCYHDLTSGATGTKGHQW